MSLVFNEKHIDMRYRCGNSKICVIIGSIALLLVLAYLVRWKYRANPIAAQVRNKYAQRIVDSHQTESKSDFTVTLDARTVAQTTERIQPVRQVQLYEGLECFKSPFVMPENTKKTQDTREVYVLDARLAHEECAGNSLDPEQGSQGQELDGHTECKKAGSTSQQDFSEIDVLPAGLDEIESPNESNRLNNVKSQESANVADKFGLRGSVEWFLLIPAAIREIKRSSSALNQLFLDLCHLRSKLKVGVGNTKKLKILSEIEDDVIKMFVGNVEITQARGAMVQLVTIKGKIQTSANLAADKERLEIARRNHACTLKMLQLARERVEYLQAAINANTLDQDVLTDSIGECMEVLNPEDSRVPVHILAITLNEGMVAISKIPSILALFVNTAYYEPGDVDGCAESIVEVSVQEFLRAGLGDDVLGPDGRKCGASFSDVLRELQVTGLPFVMGVWGEMALFLTQEATYDNKYLYEYRLSSHKCIIDTDYLENVLLVSLLR